VFGIPRPLNSQNLAGCLVRSPQNVITVNPPRNGEIPRVLRHIIGGFNRGQPLVNITVLQLAVPRIQRVIRRKLVRGIQHKGPVQYGPVIPPAVRVGQVQRPLPNPNRVHELEPKVLHETVSETAIIEVVEAARICNGTFLGTL